MKETKENGQFDNNNGNKGIPTPQTDLPDVGEEKADSMQKNVAGIAAEVVSKILDDNLEDSKRVSDCEMKYMDALKEDIDKKLSYKEKQEHLNRMDEVVNQERLAERAARKDNHDFLLKLAGIGAITVIAVATVRTFRRR